MDFSDGFRIANLAVAVFMVLGGVSHFFTHPGVQNWIVAIYIILFGIANGLLEFQIPPQVARYASFMFSFIGRGIFYIFIGSLCMGEKWWNWVAGIIIAAAGAAYVALEYVPSIEPPANMRDADAGWGAEQV
ncbi:Golgi apparatus membrane protein TVP15 [Delphinella strobiligena]|nr:Golgi apparatus membrane protein TVP15 [Delphinella strobiligena]